MIDPDLSIAELGRRLRRGEATSRQITAAALARIDDLDGGIHAFIRVESDAAIVAATQADHEISHGLDRGPMHGIPYALKDIYDAAGLPTTCHSRLRLDHVAAMDSAVAERFRNGGAILLGKLATHEFAFGGPSFDLPFPPARNPWNLERIPGGSSSGSAAAVAAGYVRVAAGSCTAGSIRGPAAWCGVVGLKPTYGRVSRRGVFPLAWSLDHCGPLARTVEDAAIALQVIAGHDPLDAASVDRPVPDFLSQFDHGVRGLRIGVPRNLFAHQPDGTSDATSDALNGIDNTIRVLREAGAHVEDIVLPEWKLFAACARVIMTSEMYTLHQADLRTRIGEFDRMTVNRFVLGATVSASDYINALRLRRILTDAVDLALAKYDVLLTAIALSTAPPFVPTPNPSAWAIQASTFNVTGHPAISVPVGLGSDGMPLAVQIAGRSFDEPTLIRVARAIEILSGWEQVSPPALHGRVLASKGIEGE